jgi:Tfp pilus assembly protein PilE
MSPKARCGGFTLVEVMIVAALIVPLLLVVGAASRGVVGSIRTTEQAAESASITVRALGRIQRILQQGRVGTLRVQATRNDVLAGRASSVGTWFEMPQRSPRPGIELFAMTGEREFALRIPSELYRFEFVRDAAELQNGRDDDADGLVDEGELQFVDSGMATKLLDRLELCTFELDGQAIRVVFRHGSRRAPGEPPRLTTLRYTVHLQND